MLYCTECNTLFNFTREEALFHKSDILNTTNWYFDKLIMPDNSLTNRIKRGNCKNCNIFELNMVFLDNLIKPTKSCRLLFDTRLNKK